MLERSFRLPSRTRFHNFQLIRTPYFVLKVAKNDLPTSRFGFIISKKVSKLAVDRNRSRRVLRSGVEDMLEAIIPGMDFLFMQTKNLRNESTLEVKELLKNIFIQRGYYK